MLASGFGFRPAGHRHLRGALGNSVVHVAGAQLVLDLLGPDQAACPLVDDHPGTGAGHESVAVGVPQEEITEVEQSVRSFVPGIQRDFVPPFRRVRKMEMHPGQHPGHVVDMQVVIAESQFLGGPIGDFLGHVHEGGRFQVERCVRVVARDADILAEFVTFSSDFAHKQTNNAESEAPPWSTAADPSAPAQSGSAG